MLSQWSYKWVWSSLESSQNILLALRGCLLSHPGTCVSCSPSSPPPIPSYLATSILLSYLLSPSLTSLQHTPIPSLLPLMPSENSCPNLPSPTALAAPNPFSFGLIQLAGMLLISRSHLGSFPCHSQEPLHLILILNIVSTGHRHPTIPLTPMSLHGLGSSAHPHSQQPLPTLWEFNILVNHDGNVVMEIKGHLMQIFPCPLLMCTRLPEYYGIDKEKSGMTLVFWYLF